MTPFRPRWAELIEEQDLSTSLVLGGTAAVADEVVDGLAACTQAEATLVGATDLLGSAVRGDVLDACG